MARILLVDDDSDVLNLGSKILEASYHDVATANTARAAMETLTTSPFDLLITDANMPDHSGFDLIHTLKKTMRLQSMPIVMLTARREQRDIERALALGVEDYIIKPLDAYLFTKKIDDLLSRHAVTAEHELAHTGAQGEASLQLTVVVSRVSEAGLLLSSPHLIHEGTVLEMNLPFFNTIGVPVPRLKVLSSALLEDSETVTYETRVSFFGADETTLQKIRAWVYQNTTRKLA